MFSQYVNQLNFEVQIFNLTKNIPVALPRSPIKIFEANRSSGARVMIGQTNRQTEITT